MKNKLHDWIIHLPMLVFFNLLFIVAYFVVSYFSNWWIEALARIFVIIFSVMFVVSFFKKCVTIKKLIFLSPAVIICFIIFVLNVEDYIGSHLEYEIRKIKFNNDLKIYQKNGNKTSELRWPAWNDDAINMRDFVYSEKALPREFPVVDGGGDCKKFSRKLDGNFYFVYFLGCGGPLF